MQHALGSRTGPRKQPPHQVEVEAAEQNVSRICHKVYLPNDTSEVSLPAPPPHHQGLTARARHLPTGVTLGGLGDAYRHSCVSSNGLSPLVRS